MAEAYKKMAEHNNCTWHDINDGNIEGFDFPQLNLNEKGQRADTYSSMLKNALISRNNLVVMRNSQVTKVIFDANGRAKGKK